MRRYVYFIIKWMLIFWVASVLIFFLVRMMPVTPEEQLLSAYRLPHTEENIAFIREEMGLDRPLFEQYLVWITDFFKGDWGYSLVSQVHIKEQFLMKMPYSMSIGLSGVFIGGCLAFFMGYRAALHRSGICGRISSFLAVFAQAVPGFLLSTLIIHLFSVKFHLVKFFTGEGHYALMSAIFLTALYCVGSLSRVVRKGFRDEMEKSYIKFAVSMGFPREKILFFYAGKPVLCRLISAVTARFAWVFGGSTVLEFAFGIPGISYFLVDSMKARDYNVLQTYILVVIIWMFLVHLILDAVLQILDVNRREK